MKLLVAIANHGTGNRQHLERLISTYQSMPIDVSIVILSNIPKDLGPGIEVRVGVPSSNPWSLPFAHRTLFKERLNDFDYFIYSEDDTLVSWVALQAFVKSIDDLHENEIAGFLRTEETPNHDLFYSTCHSYFRWIPKSVRERNGLLWASYSNQHAACFIASQAQLRHAISSGGFTEEPHEGRYDMLCTAATDIYTQCGLERLVCIDRLNEFTLPHLPNKYLGKMGLPSNEMEWQLDALRSIHQGDMSRDEILGPETSLPGGIGSKNYRESGDLIISALIPQKRMNVLVWGAGDGVFECELQDQGQRVHVLPLDSIVGHACENRGLKVFTVDQLNSEEIGIKFDLVILRDILHLMENPEKLLSVLKRKITPDGSIVIRVPNFHDVRMIKRRWGDSRFPRSWTREHIGATPFTSRSLKSLLRDSGYGVTKIHASVSESREAVNRFTLGLFGSTFSEFKYIQGWVK